MVQSVSAGHGECVLLNPLWDVDADEVFHEIAEMSNTWITDIAGWRKISKDTLLYDLSELPEIIILDHEDEFELLNSSDIPVNVSLVHYPCSDYVLNLRMDIAIRKTERRLEHNLELEKYKSLFATSSGAKLLIEPRKGDIREANPVVAVLFGIPVRELRKKTLFDLHDDQDQLISEHLLKASEGNKTYLSVRYQRQIDDIREFDYFLNPVSIQGEKFILIDIEDITEKEKTNELYYQQAEMLRNTIESIDDQLFSLNREGDFLEYYKPSGGALLTISSDVFVGKNIYDVGFPLDVAKKYLQTIDIVIKEDRHEQIDYHIEAFGSKLWYNAKISPRKNSYGEVEGVTVLCRDVTKQKKNEEALKKARDFYLTLLADFPSMIWKTNALKRPDYFNNTWLDFTGNELEEELKIEWKDKVHSADLNQFQTELSNAYKNKKSFQIEHRLKDHSGNYCWVINTGRPFYNLVGQFSGFINTCYDISERREAEEMLYLQKAAMESALEGILIIQNDEQHYPVIYANKEFSRLTGIDEEAILGEKFLEALGCPLQSEVKNRILNALKKKTRFKSEFNCVGSTSDEDASWRLLYIAPVKDKVENTNYFVAMLSDITDTKKVEGTLREKNKQLEKINQELDSFVYSTSHDLRSPLMSVLGLVNLMEADINDEEKTTYLGMIRDSISRLDKIIHDIIDYSRNTRLDVENEEIDFKEIIETVYQNHRYVEYYDRIRLSMDVDAEIPFLSDRKRIQVIINNFVSNSLRFHDLKKDEPYIDIIVRVKPDKAIVVVDDNGSGIHEKHLPKIYEMFYRGSEQSNGSGIGLYIVKETVDKLGGNILVNSFPGKGTTFKLEIPNFVNMQEQEVDFSLEQANKGN